MTFPEGPDDSGEKQGGRDVGGRRTVPDPEPNLSVSSRSLGDWVERRVLLLFPRR